MRTSRLLQVVALLGLVAIFLGTGAAFAADSGAYSVHATTDDNTSLWYTTIDRLLTNDNPTAIIHVTSKPDVEGGGALNDHVLGVWYSDASGAWRIFNQDLNSMPVDTEFNVWIPPVDASTFVHTATVANTSSHVTTIDNPLTDNLPNAVLRVTQNFNPGGGSGFYNDHAIGLYYSSGSSKWTIFNQDLVAMPEGASFNLTVLPDDPTVFVHTGAGGPNTEIDNPLTNGNPNAIVQVTQNWNPGGVGGVYNDHVIGVFYGFSRWWIFNQDFADMLPGASFNVSVPSPESAVFVHSANVANIVDNYSLIDNPLTNGNPNALVLATQSWNPGGGGGVYNDHEIGVFYASGFSKWAIFNQDQLADMPLGASFNVFVPAIDASTFVHTATAGNINVAVTLIDHPMSNDNPAAIVHVTQSWNPGGVGGIYHDHEIGVFYSLSSKWAVFNQDSTNMPVGPSFNIWIPPTDASTFVHSAAIGNTADAVTWLDHPVTNNNPDAIVFVTQNWMSFGVYHDHEIGVFYDSGRSKWTIFNQDLSTMPVGPSFNVTVVDPPFFSDGFESGDTTVWSTTSP